MDSGQRRYRILIVDDIPANVTIIGNFIKSDYAIKVAKNGAEALQVMRSDWRPDLVLLDITMPGVDGIEVCEITRQDSKIKAIPIIFVTANTDDDVLARAFQSGGNDYIRKPVNEIELTTRIKAIIDQIELAEIKKTKEKLTGAMEMAGAVCHELNQPLQAILVSAQVLLKQLPEDHQAHDMAEAIVEQSKSMGAITGKLMRITSYTTKSYLGTIKIIDLEKSTE